MNRFVIARSPVGGGGTFVVIDTNPGSSPPMWIAIAACDGESQAEVIAAALNAYYA